MSVTEADFMAPLISTEREGGRGNAGLVLANGGGQLRTTCSRGEGTVLPRLENQRAVISSPQGRGTSLRSGSRRTRCLGQCTCLCLVHVSTHVKSRQTPAASAEGGPVSPSLGRKESAG